MLQDYLFVYGTLRSAFRHPMHRWLSEHATFEGNATAQGQLYDLGSYPGVVASSGADELVFGEVYALHPPTREALLKALDAYEGCGHGVSTPEYAREQRPVTLADGRTLTAWLYRYLGSPPASRRLPSGDYLAGRSGKNCPPSSPRNGLPS